MRVEAPTHSSFPLGFLIACVLEIYWNLSFSSFRSIRCVLGGNLVRYLPVLALFFFVCVLYDDHYSLRFFFFILFVCMSSCVQVTRPSEPWEYSDGAVYLLRELCSVDSERGVLLFEEMADIARLTQFVQADCLRETIWKQVKLIFFMP